MNIATDLPRIPLANLHLSGLNARKTRTHDVDDLAASIAAHGLLQNLTVTVNDKPGEFEVVAGGRRLAAMQQLEREGRLPETLQSGVPCLVIENNDVAHEASTAENTLREPMHPADEFEAFSRMVDAGKPIEDIAAHFGVTETVVKQRLKLARVAPDLFDIYRQGRMHLSQLQALAVSNDHAAQRKAWDVRHEYERSAHHLRERLTKGGVDANSALARFVGLDAYEAAGGVVVRDLFTGEAWCQDRALLDSIAMDRMEIHARDLRDAGWSWVETYPELDTALLADYAPLASRPETSYTPEQLARDEAIDKRLSEIDDRDTDALGQEERDQLEDEQQRLWREQEDIRAAGEEKWPAEVMAKSGVIIGIDRGELRIFSARLKPGQKPGKDGAVTGEAKATAAEKAQAKATPKKPALSADLVTHLDKHRAAVARVQLLKQPRLAADLLLAHLAGQLFGQSSFGLFDVRASDEHGTTRGKTPDYDKAAARKVLDTLRKELGIPKKQAELLPWIQKLDEAGRAGLIALVAAHTFRNLTGRELDAFDKLLPLDMAPWWTPDADHFLSHVNKAVILEAVGEARGKDAAAKLVNLKRDALIAEAGKLLAGTGWMPKQLRHASYALKTSPSAKAAGKKAPVKKAAKTERKAKPNAKSKPAKKAAVKKAAAK